MNYFRGSVICALMGAFLAAITWNDHNLSADITVNALFVMALMFLIADSIIADIKEIRG